MINLVRRRDGCQVGRKWWISSIINLVYVVRRGKSPYVIQMVRNCYMSTWIAIKRCVKITHMSEVREVGHVLMIELVNIKMKGAREKGARRLTRRGFHSPKEKGN
jgi:hypothetical protein